MLEKRSGQGKREPSLEQLPPVKAKMQAAAHGLQQSTNASLRQSKSFNSKDSKVAPKPHENSRISAPHEALIRYSSSKVDAPSSVAENGAKSTKSSSIRKSEDTSYKGKQSSTTPKVDVVQPTVGRSDKVKSPRIPRNVSDKADVELQKIKGNKNCSPKPAGSSSEGDRSTASSRAVPKDKETPPKPALVHAKNLSSSLNAEPQKKLPPIKTKHAGPKNKNSANLCAECRAEVEGAVCFIGNDGRVSACTSRNAVRICKNLKCANNNLEYVASLAATIAAPKKYLVSRRHSLNLPNGRNGKAIMDKPEAQTLNQNGSASGSDDLAVQEEGIHDCDELDMKGELEDDVASLEDLNGEMVEIDGIASASPHGGRLNGHHRMRRRSLSMLEAQGPEMVTLRKQMMQERKHAEEWMLDYAIEEALQRLAPAKESKVKALVEAFESVIIPNKDTVEAGVVSVTMQG